MSVYVKRIPPLYLANVLYFEKKIRKIVVVVVHYETLSLNTLSGNGHNYYVALKHYVYMRFIFIKSCLYKHSMYMRIVNI